MLNVYFHFAMGSFLINIMVTICVVGKEMWLDGYFQPRSQQQLLSTALIDS